MGPGAKVPESERARERIGQGAKVPGTELARVLLADSLRGANWPGSEKAVNHHYYIRSFSLCQLQLLIAAVYPLHLAPKFGALHLYVIAVLLP